MNTTTRYTCEEVPLGDELATVEYDVTFSAHPPERRTRDYPGCPAFCEVEAGEPVEITTATETRPPRPDEVATLAEWFDGLIARDDRVRERLERHCLEAAGELAAERYA